MCDIHACVHDREEIVRRVETHREDWFAGDVGQSKLILTVLGLDTRLTLQGDETLKGSIKHSVSQ